MQQHVSSQAMAQGHVASVRVWDLFVRTAHWTIAVGFFAAYFAEDALTLHVWAGYAVGVVVLLRIVWGFVGPKRARFSDFLYRPSEVLAYLRDLMSFRGKRYVGHSPGGGAMVAALLVALLATVGSGLVLYAVKDNAGPLAGIVSAANAPEGAVAFFEHRETGEDAKGFDATARSPGPWREVHEVIVNLTLVLIGLHVAGVLLASYVHRENLVRAMVTGDKRPL